MLHHFGLENSLGNIFRLSKAKSFSITPENPTGEKGKGGMAVDGTGARCARDLGPGWKISPSFAFPAGETLAIASIEGPGALQSMWFGGTAARDHGRMVILRIYWDDQEQPSVECPLGDFFTLGWPGYAQNNSIAISVGPNRAFYCFWPMPFRKNCRITLENLTDLDLDVYFQVNYTLTDVPEDAAYFHAQFRRVNPLPYKTNYVLLDGVRGAGQYVGTYLAVGVTNNNWWGEGEFKFYIDGDTQYPTICGTGTEDYFGGSYNWDVNGNYVTYSTPYMGMHQLIKPDGLYNSQQRFGMYRWHIPDPIRFESDLRIEVQALGWRSGGRYLPLQCDIASVAYWYQTLPTASFPKLPHRDYLEVI
ncbi:MAG: DUF2961 domain-containing protein [Chloroflexi bacterium]|nr:DUF2961 domain-containing protein [Chloroflexota bacterium]